MLPVKALSLLVFGLICVLWLQLSGREWNLSARKDRKVAKLKSGTFLVAWDSFGLPQAHPARATSLPHQETYDNLRKSRSLQESKETQHGTHPKGSKGSGREGDEASAPTVRKVASIYAQMNEIEEELHKEDLRHEETYVNLMRSRSLQESKGTQHGTHAKGSKGSGREGDEASAPTVRKVESISAQMDEVEEELHKEDLRHEAKVQALEKQSEQLKELTDGDEEEDVGITRPIHWGTASIVAAVVVALICCGCQGLCFVNCCFTGTTSFFSEMSTMFSVSGGVYAPVDDKDTIPMIIRREMRLMMLFPLIPLLAFWQTTCEGGAPNWVYYAYIPLLLRSKLIEYRILKKLDRTDLLCSLGFILGALENLDFFTDGIFPIQAMKCDPQATQFFVQSLMESKVSFLAPLVATVHFWGLACLVLSASVLSQQVIGSGTLSGGASDICAADVSGFGAVAKHLENKQTSYESSFFSGIARVLLESCCQLWLQSSYFAVVFDQLSNSAKIKLLLSIVLGLGSVSYKASMLLLALVTGSQQNNAEVKLLLAFPILMLLLVAWVAAKLYFVWHCQDHIWNLTSGCVSISK